MATLGQLLHATQNSYDAIEKEPRGVLKTWVVNPLFTKPWSNVKELSGLKSLNPEKYDFSATDGYQKPPEGFRLLELPARFQGRHKESGHSALAYFDESTREVIIAHRGTIDWKDMKQDLAVGVFKENAADKRAKEFTDAVIDQLKDDGIVPSAIHLTGHSKGGHEAQVCATHLHEFHGLGEITTCTTFNAMGIKKSLIQENIDYKAVNVCCGLDPVSKMVSHDTLVIRGQQLGPQLYMDAGHSMVSDVAAPIMAPLNAHSLNNFHREFDKNPSFANVNVQDLHNSSRGFNDQELNQLSEAVLVAEASQEARQATQVEPDEVAMSQQAQTDRAQPTEVRQDNVQLALEEAALENDKLTESKQAPPDQSDVEPKQVDLEKATEPIASATQIEAAQETKTDPVQRDAVSQESVQPTTAQEPAEQVAQNKQSEQVNPEQAAESADRAQQPEPEPQQAQAEHDQPEPIAQEPAEQVAQNEQPEQVNPEQAAESADRAQQPEPEPQQAQAEHDQPEPIAQEPVEQNAQNEQEINRNQVADSQPPMENPPPDANVQEEPQAKDDVPPPEPAPEPQHQQEEDRYR